MNLTEQFKASIKNQNLFTQHDRLLLTVSGGVDSVVLTALCHEAGYRFAVAHCNFQLRGDDSNRDEAFVQLLAEKYNAPFHHTHFDTVTIAAQQKKTIEETARDLRYAWFKELCAANGYDYILTAHHANDNIETVLMNFFRGTGIKGLHGILPKQNNIVRPLLFATKKEIEAFAAENKLDFVTDSTNAENDFTRNYFRNEIIPAIQKVFPQVEMNVRHNIARLGEAEQLYDQAVLAHQKKLLHAVGKEWHIPVLLLKKTKPLFTVLYELISVFGFSPAQLRDVAALLQSDNGKYVASATHRIIRNRQWLIITPVQNDIAENILIETTDESVVFFRGTIQIKSENIAASFEPSADASVACLDTAAIQFPLLLRKWKQGDYFYPLGMQKKKKLSRFFIDQKLSITDKEKIWVIESNKRIIWVVGLRIDDRFKIKPSTSVILSLKYTAG
ncbi:MAG: tRNA lysidine(34) synthetase TilS [Bacteroidetes bacterium]|nr:tRNA lysidine(34) synthetase TilS [Bacteroidota bacterium]